jgi:hypothetical protein
METGIGAAGTNPLAMQQTTAPQQTEETQSGEAVGGRSSKWNLGKILAAPFKGIAALASKAFSFVADLASKATQSHTAQQSPLSVAEKTQMLDEAKNGSFFRALEGASTVGLAQRDFLDSAEILLDRPEAVQAMQDHGVTLEEAVAVHTYTTQAFYGINKQIREHMADPQNAEMTPEVAQLKDKFESGLAKLPSFEGTLYRGARLPEKVGLEYRVGNTITTTGLYSTTSDPEEAFRLVNYKIEIESKPDSGGKDISMFSEKPWEAEVAFPTGTQFEVTSRTWNGLDYDKHPPDMGNMMVTPIAIEMKEV